MKTRFFSFCIILAFAVSYSYAQKSTYVAVEVGPKFLKYENSNSKSPIKTPFFRYETAQSLHVGHEIGKNFYAEIGAGYHYYGESFRIENVFGYGTSSTFAAYEFPLRLRGEVEILKDWVSLSAIAGYTFVSHFKDEKSDPNIPDARGSFFLSGGFGSTVDSVRTEDASFYISDGSFGLIETGISINVQFDEAIQFYFLGNYKAGLNKIIETEVNYRINDLPYEQTHIFSKGSYFSFKAGIRMNFARIWQSEE